MTTSAPSNANPATPTPSSTNDCRLQLQVKKLEEDYLRFTAEPRDTGAVVVAKKAKYGADLEMEDRKGKEYRARVDEITSSMTLVATFGDTGETNTYTIAFPFNLEKKDFLPCKKTASVQLTPRPIPVTAKPATATQPGGGSPLDGGVQCGARVIVDKVKEYYTRVTISPMAQVKSVFLLKASKSGADAELKKSYGDYAASTGKMTSARTLKVVMADDTENLFEVPLSIPSESELKCIASTVVVVSGALEQPKQEAVELKPKLFLRTKLEGTSFGPILSNPAKRQKLASAVETDLMRVLNLDEELFSLSVTNLTLGSLVVDYTVAQQNQSSSSEDLLDPKQLQIDLEVAQSIDSEPAPDASNNVVVFSSTNKVYKEESGAASNVVLASAAVGISESDVWTAPATTTLPPSPTSTTNPPNAASEAASSGCGTACLGGIIGGVVVVILVGGVIAFLVIRSRSGNEDDIARNADRRDRVSFNDERRDSIIVELAPSPVEERAYQPPPMATPRAQHHFDDIVQGQQRLELEDYEEDDGEVNNDSLFAVLENNNTNAEPASSPQRSSLINEDDTDFDPPTKPSGNLHGGVIDLDSI